MMSVQPNLFRRTGRTLVFLMLGVAALSLAGLAHGFQTQTRQVPVDSFIYDLKNPDAVRRREAAKALGDNKVQRAVPDLVAVAADPDAGVRRAVITALSNMNDMRALPAFVNQTGDAEKDIREKCIDSIMSLYLPQEGGVRASVSKVANFFNPWSDEWAEIVIEPGIAVDPSVVAALRKRMEDSDANIQIKSCRALGILKSADAIPSIVAPLQKESTNALRFESIRSLRKIGDPAPAKELMNYLNYSDVKLRNEAVYTIGRLRYRPAVPELTRLYEKETGKPEKLIDKPYQEKLIDAVAYIADPSSRELFIKERMNPDDLLRVHAIAGLARLGEASLVTDISRDWLSEKNPKIQTAQTYALYRMGRKEYLDDLTARLGDSKTSSEARQYLMELKPDELPELYAQVRNTNVAVREGLAEVIGWIGDNRAIPVLQELSKDSRGDVASLANQALRRVQGRTGGV